MICDTFDKTNFNNVCKWNGYIKRAPIDFWFKIPKRTRENLDCTCSQCIYEYGLIHCKAKKKALWICVSPENQDIQSFKKFLDKKCRSKFIDKYWYVLEWRKHYKSIKDKNFIVENGEICPGGLHAHIFLYYNNRYAKQNFRSDRCKGFKMVSKIYSKPIKGQSTEQWEKECIEYCKYDGVHIKEKSKDWITKKKNDVELRKHFEVSHFINNE